MFRPFHRIERNDIAPIVKRTQPLQIVAIDGMDMGTEPVVPAAMNVR
jgi:hypothetical protein